MKFVQAVLLGVIGFAANLANCQTDTFAELEQALSDIGTSISAFDTAVKNFVPDVQHEQQNTKEFTSLLSSITAATAILNVTKLTDSEATTVLGNTGALISSTETALQDLEAIVCTHTAKNDRTELMLVSEGRG